MDLLSRIQQLNNSGTVSKDVYTALYEYTSFLTSNNLPVIYNLRHVRKLFQIKKSEQDLFFGDKRKALYHTFYIPKKAGGFREIEAPNKRLKHIQRWIYENILLQYKPSDSAMGFIPGKSIVDNASKHVGKELVINMDIKDFFPSIKYADVFRLFVYMGYKKDVAHLLTKLCTNSNNVLPQGSPASPAISNLVLLHLDARLAGLAKSYDCSYSRYADDITFSGNSGIKNIVQIAEAIILDEGYSINTKKTRLAYKYQRQEVTGLIVNEKVSVPSKIEKELNNAIYFSNKYGVIDHMNKIKCDKAFYMEHLYGLAYYVKMVDETKGENYLRQLAELKW